MPRIWIVAAILAMAAAAGTRAAESDIAVSIVTDPQLSPPASHGLAKIMEAFSAKTDSRQPKGVTCEKVESMAAARGKVRLVIGLAGGGGPAAELLKAAKVATPVGPEALVIQHTEWQGKPAILVAGSDDRGLMYAELDIADRIGWAADAASPLSEVRDAAEKPDAPERALSMYTMNRAYWESRFYDHAYWTRYLDVLARNRFNSVVIIFGYENGGFLAPPYPYFFDIDGFPDVRMVDIKPEEQARNLAALKGLIRMAHERGLRVTLGIWDHIYRGGVQGGGTPGASEALRKPTHGLVWGVNEKNLVPYTKAALAEFLRRVPEVDALQFRMHDESGLKKGEQAGFWHDIFMMMKQVAPNVRFDARAKGLPDSVIEDGLAAGVNVRIDTKYWMEQMGMPWHPTHINRQNQNDRRHSYADLLHYPRQYKMHWRLWNGGTARVCLWGDPDFARRFVGSTHLYDGDGFEVNEPLCTKMEAQAPDAKPFDLLRPQYRYYDYEFERYWHFFQVYGRLGYNSETPPEVWQKEFEKRFGKDAGPLLEKGLHRASWILPRIVGACYPYSCFPMTRGWAEKQRLGDLPAYAKAEGSDIAQFASFDEEAENLIEGTETAKTRPPETSLWFARTAEEVLAHAAEAEKRIGDRRGKEFTSTVTDLRILANLALFHSRRIPAAVNYCLFKRTGNPRSLDDAIAGERSAVEAWRQLVAAAGDVYTDDLAMGARGAGLCGHWRDELVALEKGLKDLEKQRQDAKPPAGTPKYVKAVVYASAPEPPAVRHQPVTAAPAGKPLTIAAEVRSPKGIKWVRLRYRIVNQREDYQTLPMQPAGGPDRFEAVVPAAAVDPKWDFMYYIEVMDNAGCGKIYPDMEKETPYVVVRLQR